MKEIEQIVTDYLDAEKTDYALMINGDWGCGKTYYIKRHLFAQITSIDSHLKNDKDEPIKYEPLYISLYGIADIQDMLYKIQLELNSWMKSKAWGLFRGAINKAASVIGTDATKEDEKEILSALSIKKNKVLFFDDLERIDTNKISFSSVLGQINHFTEQDNLKVIIVCNSSKTDEIFNQINEKTIRFSCLYDPEIGIVYDQMITEYTQPYLDFLKEKKHVIIEVFDIAKYKNLRTLRFILDIFQKIYTQTYQFEYKDEILTRFLFFTCIYAIEYKLGANSEEDLNSLKNVGPYSLIDFDFDFLNPGVQNRQQEVEKSYSQLFSERYAKIIESFFYCQEIADYVQNGYLNEGKLAIIITDIIKEIKDKEGTEEDKLIRELRNWRELKDEDFEPLKENILNKIEEGRFTLMAYPIIFAEFLQLEYYKIDGFEVTPDIIEMFKIGIDKSKENHKYLEAFRIKVPMWSDSGKTPARNKYHEISNYTIEANDFALSKIFVDLTTSIISNITQNKSKELQEIITDQSLWGSPLFDSMDPTKVFNLLINANSETISAFNMGLYGRYPENSVNTLPSFQKERTFFCELQILIENHLLAVKPIKISTVQFIDLDRNLRRISNL